MIKIICADKYRSCNSCGSDKSVKELLFSRCYSNSLGVALCEKCLNEMVNIIQNECFNKRQ